MNDLCIRTIRSHYSHSDFFHVLEKITMLFYIREYFKEDIGHKREFKLYTIHIKMIRFVIRLIIKSLNVYEKRETSD